MNTTAVLILIAIVALGGILWLVFYSGRQREKHREQTSIKPPDSHREGHAR